MALGYDDRTPCDLDSQNPDQDGRCSRGAHGSCHGGAPGLCQVSRAPLDRWASGRAHTSTNRSKCPVPRIRGGVHGACGGSVGDHVRLDPRQFAGSGGSDERRPRIGWGASTTEQAAVRPDLRQRRLRQVVPLRSPRDAPPVRSQWRRPRGPTVHLLQPTLTFSFSSWGPFVGRAFLGYRADDIENLQARIEETWPSLSQLPRTRSAPVAPPFLFTGPVVPGRGMYVLIPLGEAALAFVARFGEKTGWSHVASSPVKDQSPFTAVLLWGTDAKEALPDKRKGPLTCGGAKGTRTPNPLLAKQVRYQLRHGPENTEPARTRRAGGIRDETSRLAGSPWPRPRARLSAFLAWIWLSGPRSAPTAVATRRRIFFTGFTTLRERGSGGGPNRT